MLKSQKNREKIQYLLVGGFCAILNNIILIGGDFAGLHYSILIFFVFLTILPASYAAHCMITFKEKLSLHGFSKFIVGSISSVILTSFIIWMLRGALSIPMTITGPVTTAIMIIYNFIMSRWAIRSSKFT